MSVSVDTASLCGYALVQRVAQSYLGPLWVAVDQRDQSQKGAHALVRQLQLPEDASPEARENIAQAARAARALRHPNILTVLDVLEDGKELGVVYEHVAAEPLRSLQTWGNMRSIPFPIGVSLRIVIDLLAALESLHRSHSSAAALPSFGGLSPDSVLVSRTGETFLCDALVARAAAAVESVGHNPVKLGYTAPEQVRPDAEVTLQSDLFAVGAMLWELSTGRRWLLGSREVIERKLLAHQLPKLLDALRPGQLSTQLVASVEAALAADPGQRPATAHAMTKQLEACGHPVASRQEVAQFVEKLSGQRLERRTASLQARAAQQGGPASRRPFSELSIAAARPADSSIITSALQMPPAPAAAAPVEVDAPPARADEKRAEERPSAVEYIEPSQHETAAEHEDEAMRSTEFDLPPAVPASAVDSEPTIASVAAAAPPVRAKRPDNSRTMIGLGLPDAAALNAALMAAKPMTTAQPAPAQPPQPAAPEVPRAAAAVDAPAPEAPTSSSDLHAFSLPPPEPVLRSPVAARLKSRARSASSARNLAFAVIGAAVALGAVALGITLRSSTADAGAESAALATPPEGDAPSSAAAARPAPEALPTPAGAEPAPPAAGATPDAEAERAAESPDAEAQPAAAPTKDYFVAKLDDRQLAELFALEKGKDLPECSDRLGKRNAAKYTGKQTKLARARLANAKRALQAGKHDTALTELCAATAHDRSNVEAQRALAELALNLGDAPLAKAAAERALAAAKKKKDPELLAVLGDALALLGDVAASRKAWLDTDPKGSEAQRRQRLATAYQKAAERAVASHKLSLARLQLRRVMVLTQGSYTPSVDFAQTLLSLEQPRAALPWAERAARALPKNVRAQILLGDAHAASGDTEKARAAWRGALKLQPKNAVASARLRNKRG